MRRFGWPPVCLGAPLASTSPDHVGIFAPDVAPESSIILPPLHPPRRGRHGQLGEGVAGTDLVERQVAGNVAASARGVQRACESASS